MAAAREVGHLCCFQSPSATVGFRPTSFVTIDEHLERKVLAIRAFASRAEVRGYLERGLIESSAGYWSRFGDGRYAEAFEVVRDAAATAQPGGPVPGRAAEPVLVRDRPEVAHVRLASPAAAVRPGRGGTSVSP